MAIVVEVILNAGGNFAEQAIVNVLLGQFAQSFDGINVHVETVRIVGAEGERVTAFSDRDDDFLLLEVIPCVASFEIGGPFYHVRALSGVNKKNWLPRRHAMLPYGRIASPNFHV